MNNLRNRTIAKKMSKPNAEKALERLQEELGVVIENMGLSRVEMYRLTLNSGLLFRDLHTANDDR